MMAAAEGDDETSTIAIKIKEAGGKITVGISKICNKQLQFVEFIDNTNLDGVESILLQMAPNKQCLLPQGHQATFTYKVLKTLLDTHEMRTWYARFVKNDILDPLTSRVEFLSDSPIAIEAISAIVTHLDIQQSFSEYTVSHFNAEEFLRLDTKASEGLHVFASDNSKQMHLFRTLHHCRTSGGERLLRMWLAQPLRDAARIRARLEAVQVFVNSADIRLALHDQYLRKIPDVSRLTDRLMRKTVDLEKLYKLYAAAHASRPITAWMKQWENDGGPLKDCLVQPLEKCNANLDNFIKMMETTIDHDGVKERQFRIRPDFSDELSEINRRIGDLKEAIGESARKAANKLGAEKNALKLMQSATHGWFFRLTLKDERLLRGNKDFRVFDTAKDGVKFRDASLSELNGQFSEETAAYKAQQDSIIREIVDISQGYASFFAQLGQLLSVTDVFVSFAVASVAAPIPYVKPVIEEDGQRLELVQVRHPCLEQMENMSYISNDIKFRKDDSVFHVLTGPNLGGKSTYLRSVALSVLMAQVGCFVPCQSAILSPVDKILVRIGAGDSQLKGISTFMAEMLEAAKILRTATPRSLVLIDELGRGTSTYDGLGLAWAISHHIATQIKAPTLFATHFHELTHLASEVPSVKNFHVSAITDNDTFTLLYEVLPGSCDQSFGLQVAKIAKFPQAVLDDAAEELREAEMMNWLEYACGDRSSEGRQRLAVMEELIGQHEKIEKDGDESEREKLRERLRKQLAEWGCDVDKLVMGRSTAENMEISE